MINTNLILVLLVIVGIATFISIKNTIKLYRKKDADIVIKCDSMSPNIIVDTSSEVFYSAPKFELYLSPDKDYYTAVTMIPDSDIGVVGYGDTPGKAIDEAFINYMTYEIFNQY